MPTAKQEGSPVPRHQRIRQLGRDAAALGWRSAAGMIFFAPVPLNEPVKRVVVATVAGSFNRLLRGIEFHATARGEQDEPALLRDIESVLVAVNVIAAPYLLNSQIGIANKLILTVGAVAAELALLYAAREPASHRGDLHS